MSGEKAAGNVLHLATKSGWYRFERNGGGWSQASKSLTYWSMTCLAIDPSDQKLVYAGTERSGIFVSRDGGESWVRPDPNVPRLLISSLLAQPGTVLVGTVPAALYRGVEGGWQEVGSLRENVGGAVFPPSPDLGARTRYLAQDPSSPVRLYAGIEVGGMLISDDGGASWKPANEGLTDPDVHQVLPSAKAEKLVLAACGEGVFRSVDRGAHWEEITPAGSRTYGTAVAEDRSGTLYLGITRGRPNTWLRSERADGAILCSADSGKRWEIVAQGLRGGVLDICTGPSGLGAIAGTSEGEVIEVTGGKARIVAEGLPCIEAIAVC